MPAHHGASAGAVDINIARFNLRFRALDVRGTAREKSGGERVVRAVGNRDCFVEIAHFQNADHRSENFFARDTHVRFHVAKNGRRNEKAFWGHILTLVGEGGLRLSNLNVIQDAVVRGFVDHRTDGDAWLFRISDAHADGGL